MLLLIQILYVANKRLPDNDYRISYPQFSNVCSVTYALPGKPETLDEIHFTHMGFDEGLRFSDIYHFWFLFIYLLKKRDKFDLVHYFSTNLTLLGPVLAWWASLPSIITITGFGRVFAGKTLKFRFSRAMYLLLMRVSAKCTQLVLFQNHDDMVWLSRKLPAFSHKFRYVGSAVSMPVTRDKCFSTTKLRVLLVARLMPDKGVEDFLHVAERLHRREFEFVLVGPRSTGFDGLLAKVQEFHDRGIIDYKGELDPTATQQQFARTHIFYFPSSYPEGLARVMLEAGFAQVCPIAYDIPATRDLVDEGRGFLVEKKNTKCVIEILECLSKNRDLLIKNASTYQDYILEHYSMKIYSRRIDDILCEVTNGTR